MTLCSLFFKVDAALIATGRAPFTNGLGLENVRDNNNKPHPLMNICFHTFGSLSLFGCERNNLHALFSTQINVATQRGFIPVDERMRVIDGNGKLVSVLFIRTS